MGEYWKDYSTTIKAWKDVIDFVEREKTEYEDWVYRGLRNESYTLKSTFDRWIENVNDQTEKDANKIKNSKRWKYEAYLLYQFKRRAHFYLKKSDVPKPNDYLEWFSLMRHYGCPSRMIDCTYSFYIALYFAIYEEGKTNACVFRINRKWLVEKVEQLVGNDKVTAFKRKKYFQTPSVFYKYTMYHPDDKKSQPKPFIIPVRPFISNERIHLQRGLFLCPANVNYTFEDNLKKSVKNDYKQLEGNIIKIIIDKKAIPEIMNELRKMNISSETLFPGLSGFAGSLIELFYLPKKLLPDEARLKQSIMEKPEPYY